MEKSIFERLSNSNFRSKFKLQQKDIEYVKIKGISEIKKHAYDFVGKRLAPAIIENDGKQTPMRGHPVFIAQHATATCCRKCLFKWHGIKPNKALSKSEIDYVVNVIIQWIIIQL